MIKQTFSVTIETDTDNINTENIAEIISRKFDTNNYLKVTVVETVTRCNLHNDRDCELCSVMEL